MFNTVGEQVVHHIKLGLRVCFTQTSVINLALLPEQHSPQGMGPTSSYLKINSNFISIADGDDDDLLTVENFQFGQAPVFSIMVFEQNGETQGAVQRAAQRRRVHGEVVGTTTSFFLTNLKTLFFEPGIIGGIKLTMPCTTSRNKSRMLLKNIYLQPMNKSKEYVLLPRVVQHRT